ncbi:glycoside hydrolase family 5 protein [Eubacteriales bacterium OttesenSCG-928-A19]|nr:glycoside hydrolase family 5 protein [Eubacteriales bacterium OttesenSCG-928-A19]
MDMLQVRDGKVVDTSGKPVYLRGTCVGGWMNMEDFINGYPGTEGNIRRHMTKVLGEKRAQFFFECLLDAFFNEDDIRFIAEQGATCVRLPLNYRHFEDDADPFVYKESGFARLEEAVKLCEKHGLYVILDMHAVQGWQNSHWHSDNERGASLFWTHKQFQDRLAGLWQAIAERYRGRAAIAGYELMNEPSSNTPCGDHPFDFFENFTSDWPTMNRVYRRLVEDIRKVDPDHIIFIEGDRYGHYFDGMDAPFAPNLVYSNHFYTPPGFGPGVYPGLYGRSGAEIYWDKNKHRMEFRNDQGYIYAQEHNVPLWVGEFGSQYHGPKDELPYRLQNMDDQLSVYNEYGAHWTTWTYKDAGVMGWVTLNPESELMRMVEPVQRMKRELGAENFVALYQRCPGREKAAELADMILDVSQAPYNRRSNALSLNYAALTGFAASILQPVYAMRFKGMNESDIERVLQAYRLRNCVVNDAYVAILNERLRESIA